MNEVTITFDNGLKQKYKKGITVLEIANSDKLYKNTICGSFNNITVQMDYVINKSGNLKLYSINDSYGNKIYERGLIYLFKVCANEVLENKTNIRVRYSIDKGVFFELEREIKEEELENIKKLMHEKVKQKIPFTRVETTMSEALTYFKSIKRFDKVKTLFYNKNNYVTLYKFEDTYNYIMGMLPYDSSILTTFELTKINDSGLVLRYPSVYDNGKITKFKHHEKFFNSIDEYLRWSKILNISSIGELNDEIISKRPGELINLSETLQNYRLQEIAMKIYMSKDNIKIVLLSGPSSSGKTTTARKLSMYLKAGGLNPIPISLDDYFLNRDETPLNEDGKPDFESLRAIDVKLFDKQINQLLKGNKVTAPTFDFIEGKKVFNKQLKLNDNDILVVEGLHALSNELLQEIPKNKKFKIYISPLVYLNVDDDNRINQTDIRLLRRMVRDYRTRGYNSSITLAAWDEVRNGEEKYVFSYQDEADVIFNTFLSYELAVMKVYVLPLLYQIQESDPGYLTAVRLIKLLDLILPLPSEDVPSLSILREFIGTSYFDN